MESSRNGNVPSRGNNSVWQVGVCTLGSELIDTVTVGIVKVEGVKVVAISTALSLMGIQAKLVLSGFG